MRKTILLAFVVAQFALVFQAYSLPDRVGGGGDGITLSDDTVVLADPYVDRLGVAHIKELHPRLREQLQLVGTILEGYGAKPEVAKQIVLDPRREYRFVDQIPDLEVCKRRLKTHASHLIACSENWVTWILKSDFKKMSIREQSLLIYHEGLQVHSPQIRPTVLIADLTTAMKRLLELRAQQVSYFNSGRFEQLGILESKDLELIRLMVNRLRQVGMNGVNDEVFSDYAVHPKGGGLVWTKYARVSPDAFVGIGSLVTFGLDIRFIDGAPKTVFKQAVVKPNAFIIGTNCSGCRLESGAKVFDSEQLLLTEVGNSTVRRSELGVKAKVGNGSMVINSKVAGRSVISGNLLVQDSQVTGTLLAEGSVNSDRWFAEILGSEIRAGSIEVKKGVRITDSDVHMQGSETKILFEEGSQLQSVHLTVKGPKKYSRSVLEFGKRSVLQGIAKSQLMMKAGLRSSAKVRFDDGTVIVSHGKPICPTGEVLNSKGWTAVETETDLADLCEGE